MDWQSTGSFLPGPTGPLPHGRKKNLLAAEYSKNGNLLNGWTGSLAALLGHGIFDIWLIGFILIREKYFSIM